jgi:hypothetical protein
MDKYVDVITISWLKRYKNALLGLLFAPIFIFVAFIILRHCEIEHAITTNALHNIEGHVKEMANSN